MKRKGARRGRSRRGRRLAQPTPLYKKRGFGQALGAAANVANKVARVYRAAKSVRRTITKTRKRVVAKRTPAMGTAQMTFLTKKYGKRMSASATGAMKMASLAEDDIVMRWQKTNPYAAASGAMYMSRTVVGVPTTGNSTEEMPLDIFDLSGVAYNALGLGSLDLAKVAYKLRKRWITAGVYLYEFFQFGGETNTGGAQSSTGSIWSIERASNSSTTATQVKRDLFKWLELKMMCIGSTSLPTRFTIELINLNEECLHPVVTGQTWTGDSTDQLFIRRNQFWENEVLRYVDGPTASMGNHRNLRKSKKVLHSISFVIQPKTSIELDQEGDYKIVKIFKWLNKIQRYDWLNQAYKPYINDPLQPIVPGGVATAYTQGDTWAVPTNGPPGYNTFNNVELPKRLYLTVKAESYYPGQTTNVTCVPSYDLVIRKCHTVSEE